MNNQNLQDCITSCWECRNECQKMLFNHCLQQDGEHVKADHLKLMTDCIQICQIAADFMIRNSRFYKDICEVCAIICDACAKSCESLNDKEMDQCAKACRSCAESCRSVCQ